MLLLCCWKSCNQSHIERSIVLHFNYLEDLITGLKCTQQTSKLIFTLTSERRAAKIQTLSHRIDYDPSAWTEWIPMQIWTDRWAFLWNQCHSFSRPFRYIRMMRGWENNHYWNKTPLLYWIKHKNMISVKIIYWYSVLCKKKELKEKRRTRGVRLLHYKAT